MVTGLTIVALVLAALNAWVAVRTYRSQQGSEKLFGQMNDVLHQMELLQKAMNARDLHLRQEWARTAVHTLITALRRQVSVLDGQWQGVPPELDPLEPIRVYETELSWIPTCAWKEKCQDILRAVGPLPLGSGAGLRAGQWNTLTNGCRDLVPAGQSPLCETCLQAIDEMQGFLQGF